MNWKLCIFQILILWVEKKTVTHLQLAYICLNRVMYMILIPSYMLLSSIHCSCYCFGVPQGSISFMRLLFLLVNYIVLG